MDANLLRQILAALLGLSLTPAAFSQSTTSSVEHQQQVASGIKIVQPGQLKWKPNPALPKGGRQALLRGNPKKPGALVVEVMLPTHYRIPPHTHPQTEFIHVLSGDFHFGEGRTFDRQKTTLVKPGGYLVNPAGTPHYVWTNRGARFVVMTKAPTGVHYINPKDDPKSKG